MKKKDKKIREESLRKRKWKEGEREEGEYWKYDVGREEENSRKMEGSKEKEKNVRED